MASPSKKECASQPSLGAAMVGAQPAPGFHSPEEDLPGPWMDLFQEQHAGPAVYNGLFTACPQGRDWVLAHTSKATLTMDTTAELSAAEWAGRLDAARQALDTRGALPTDLVVVLAESADSEAACLQLLSALGGAGHGIGKVTLRVKPGPAAKGSTTVSDTVQNLLCQFLIPDTLPQLGSVHIVAQNQSLQDSVVQSIATRLPQLSSPHLDARIQASQWPQLLSPATTTHTLNSFSTDSSLTDELLGLLLKHAPALSQLSVWNIRVELGQYGVWGVQQLKAYEVDGNTLPLLPMGPQGCMHMDLNGVCVDFIGEEGLSQHVIECLSEGRITCKQLNLSLDVWIPPQQRPHALTTLLAQLHDVDTGPDTLVMLKGLKWTHETAQILATALPTLPHLRVGVDFFDSLTDELLAVAKHMGPHVRRLSVPGVLLSADYNHEPWPWPGAELYSASLRLSEAVKLPRIDGATPGSVECGYLGVDDEVAREVDIVPWGSMQLYEDIGLELAGWPMTHLTMPELQRLPSFPGHLITDGMGVDVWPLAPQEYHQLGTYIPSSFTAWNFGAPFSIDSPLA